MLAATRREAERLIRILGPHGGYQFFDPRDGFYYRLDTRDQSLRCCHDSVLGSTHGAAVRCRARPSESHSHPCHPRSAAEFYLIRWSSCLVLLRDPVIWNPPSAVRRAVGELDWVIEFDVERGARGFKKLHYSLLKAARLKLESCRVFVEKLGPVQRDRFQEAVRAETPYWDPLVFKDPNGESPLCYLLLGLLLSLFSLFTFFAILVADAFGHLFRDDSGQLIPRPPGHDGFWVTPMPILPVGASAPVRAVLESSSEESESDGTF